MQDAVVAGIIWLSRFQQLNRRRRIPLRQIHRGTNGRNIDGLRQRVRGRVLVQALLNQGLRLFKESARREDACRLICNATASSQLQGRHDVASSRLRETTGRLHFGQSQPRERGTFEESASHLEFSKLHDKAAGDPQLSCAAGAPCLDTEGTSQIVYCQPIQFSPLCCVVVLNVGDLGAQAMNHRVFRLVRGRLLQHSFRFVQSIEIAVGVGEIGQRRGAWCQAHRLPEQIGRPIELPEFVVVIAKHREGSGIPRVRLLKERQRLELLEQVARDRLVIGPGNEKPFALRDAAAALERLGDVVVSETQFAEVTVCKTQDGVRKRKVRIEIDRVLEMGNRFVLSARGSERTRARIGFQRVERRSRHVLERHIESLDRRKRFAEFSTEADAGSAKRARTSSYSPRPSVRARWSAVLTVHRG